MFIEGKCPKCQEKIQVPEDREKILCMYCGAEIFVKDALGKKEEMDLVAYGENFNKAMMGMDMVIQKCYKPMETFRKNRYEAVFEEYFEKYRETLDAIDCVYRMEEQKEAWLQKVTLRLIDAAKDDIKSYKFKGQQTQRQMDLNFLISIYLIPSILKYPASFAEPLADEILSQWNQAFKVTLGKAHFDEIEKGFHKKLCYITTAICENLDKGLDCKELQMLKDYRDHYMEQTEEGRLLVEEYYDFAPTIVKRIQKEENYKEIYQNLYQEYLQPCIAHIEAAELELCKEKYQEMVELLKSKYIS